MVILRRGEESDTELLTSMWQSQAYFKSPLCPLDGDPFALS